MSRVVGGNYRFGGGGVQSEVINLSHVVTYVLSIDWHPRGNLFLSERDAPLLHFN